MKLMETDALIFKKGLAMRPNAVNKKGALP
jgi:hypothetical protein